MLKTLIFIGSFLCVLYLSGQDYPYPIPNVNVGIENGENSHYGHSIVAVEDGYVMTSVATCFGSIGCRELIKTDFAGNVIWQNIWTAYPTSSFLAPNTLLETSVGYISCGAEYNTVTDWDAMVFMITEDGDSLWKYTYNFEQSSFKPESARKIAATLDSGYIVGGSSETHSVYLEEVLELYLFKIDSLGTLEWQRVYRPFGKQFSEVASLSVEEDGGYFISGYVGNDTIYGNYRAVFKHPFIMKTDSLGNVLWSKNYEKNRYWLECPAKTLVLPDYQGYIMQSCLPSDTLDPAYDPFHEHHWYYVSRLDTGGHVLWTHTFEAEDDKLLKNIRLSRDSLSFFGVGQDFNHEEEDSLFSFNNVGWMFEMSIEGELLWERQYASREHYKKIYDLYDVVETENCMIAATGWINDTIPDENPSMTNSGGGNVWLMVVDSLGCPLVGCYFLYQ